MRRLLTVVAMVLSIVPLALAVPRVRDALAPGRDARATEPDRSALPFPAAAAATVPAPAGPARPAAAPRAVPVLVYHGVAPSGPARDRWSVSRPQLARQLTALRRAGYRTIAAATYVRFLRGETVRLPRRPLLVTFDDGRLDSFRGADAVLERVRMRALIFAIVERLADGSPGYLRPSELRAMRASGRWDVGLHAGRGHRLVRAAGGGRGPFYATREPGESLAEWRSRVAGDLADGARRLAAEVPGARTDLFAVPYSDFGQGETGEPALSHALARMWKRTFAATFVQRDEARFSRPGRRGFVDRYEVGRATTVADLLGWLARSAR